jgi:hypothetical protein
MNSIAADREAIRTLIAAIKYQKDMENDPEALAQLWARKATYVIESGGRRYGEENKTREDVTAFNVQTWKDGAHGTGDTKEVHIVEPPHIEPLGDGRYRAIYKVAMFGIVDGKWAPVGTGLIHDDCVEEEGAWRVYARFGRLKRL